jgi:hypothetical protein
MLSQRYISSDLTHFVGRSQKNHGNRYKLLKRILRTGQLQARPRAKGMGPEVRVVTKDAEMGLSSNQACGLPIVCFCDIPLCDLPIHMAKYSKFGLAFPKDFLAEMGAVPVTYVPLRGRPASLPYEGYSRKRVASQAVCFDEFWKVLNRLEATLLGSSKQTPSTPFEKDVRRLTTFLEVHLVSNLKFFDHRLVDVDIENFYMEREWRVCQDVSFDLNDVARVILPEAFGRQFRKDFPAFGGELVFSDWEH